MNQIFNAQISVAGTCLIEVDLSTAVEQSCWKILNQLAAVPIENIIFWQCRISHFQNPIAQWWVEFFIHLAYVDGETRAIFFQSMAILNRN